MEKESPSRGKSYHVLSPDERTLLSKKLSAAARLRASGRASKSLAIAARCEHDALIFRDTVTGDLLLTRYECRKKYCPSCGIRWADEIKSRLLPKAIAVDARDLRHIVLTIPNAPEGSLEERLGQLYESFREWRNQGRRGKSDRYWEEPTGYAWKLEIDKKRGKTWHPHLHVLFHRPGGMNLRHGSRARESWARITAAKGAGACLRNGIWVTAPKSSQVAREVAKYSAKPIQVARWSIASLAEVASATKGLRWTASSGSLHHAAPSKGEGDGRLEVVGSAMSLVQRAFNDTSVPDFALHAVTAWLEENPEHSHAFPECVRPSLPQEEL